MDQEWALSRRVGGPSMDQGRSSTVSEKWEGGGGGEGGGRVLPWTPIAPCGLG